MSWQSARSSRRIVSLFVRLAVSSAVVAGIVLTDYTRAVSTGTPLVSVCPDPSALTGPSSPPRGAVVVPPNYDNSIILSRPHTTYWFAPGVHVLGVEASGQISPSFDDAYIGGPNAIIDGADLDKFAFTHRARNVTIKYLTIENFLGSRNHAVVNTDGGAGWVIDNDTIRGTRYGAGLRLGLGSTMSNDCLKSNHQRGVLSVLATKDPTVSRVKHKVTGGRSKQEVKPNLGVYVGAADVGGVKSFVAATETDVTIAADFLPQDLGWGGLDGEGGSLNWLTSAWADSGYTLVLGVPLIPNDSSGTPLGTLAGGAAGNYNDYFLALAQTLVDGGLGNAYLRLGFEFDGTWTSWSVSDRAEAIAFAEYWRNVVTTMRSVPGAQFKYIWNPAGLQVTSWNLADAYPGDGYVNEIGFDLYDQSWYTDCIVGGNPHNVATPTQSNCVFNDMLTQPNGLNWLVSFAQAHHKAITVPEWAVIFRFGGHGLGDDPIYLSNVYHWMTAHHFAFAIYWNYDNLGGLSAITDGKFPRTKAVFENDFAVG